MILIYLVLWHDGAAMPREQLCYYDGIGSKKH